jgi:hypothetical protein
MPKITLQKIIETNYSGIGEDTNQCLLAVKDWLKEKQKEVGDNDEYRALDLLKDLLQELGVKPFRAYLRCVAPSESCFFCSFIVQCRELNKPTVANKKTESEK